jgi:hypothetical protein
MWWNPQQYGTIHFQILPQQIVIGPLVRREYGYGLLACVTSVRLDDAPSTKFV